MSFSEIPNKFTQGDYVSWSIVLEGYNPSVVSVFIRGMSNPLDLTGVANNNAWDFEITATQSALFDPGDYQAQLVIFDPNRKTICTNKLHICPSLENLTELDTRCPEEIELDALNQAIASLTSGKVVEYYIGMRRVRYHELASLYDRQNYLMRRIARKKNKSAIGGCNVPVNYCG